MENKRIQSLGGIARAKKVSAEKLSSIGARGAAARWPSRATHRGNFQKEFGIDVECYVLDDAAKTPVISQSGMGRALGLAQSGKAFPRFLATNAISALVGAELASKISQPIKFQWGTGGAEQPPATIHGFDVTLLIDLCHVIVEARRLGKLGARHVRVADQAQVILNASAKAGIRGLVYALAGYNPTAEEVIKAFKTYVQEEAKKYEKEFPPELYAEWYRIYKIPPIQGRGRPWHFKQLTVNHVYAPLAKSNGKILSLLKEGKSNKGDRQNKLFQFLSEVGTRALRFHLGRLVEMAESSADKGEYERKITQRFGGQQEFDLTIAEPPATHSP